MIPTLTLNLTRRAQRGFFMAALLSTAALMPVLAATVTFQGHPVELVGKFPQLGDTAPAMHLTTAELKEVGLDAWAGRSKVLNIFVSADTPVCDASLRHFNEMASKLRNTVVLGISQDLPFAQKRFCASAGIENVNMLSSFRDPGFARDYGVAIIKGPLRGLTARGVVVLDEKNRVIHSQLVSEVTQEPDYEKVLAVLTAR